MNRTLSALWGPSATIMRRLVNSTIIPALLYGCEVWFPDLDELYVKNALLRVYNSCARIITGAFKNRSISGSQEETVELERPPGISQAFSFTAKLYENSPLAKPDPAQFYNRYF